MMTSLLRKFSNPSFALLWYIVKNNRWKLVVIFSSIPTILLFNSIIHFIFGTSLLDWSAKFHAMLLIIIFPFLAMVITYSELNTSTAKTGIPRFSFIHPVSSLHLALVPIIFGILLSFTFMFFWFQLIVQLDSGFFENSIILTTCIIGVVWLQFISWRLSNAPYLTIIIFLILVALLFIFIVSLWNLESTPHLINANLAKAGLLALMTSGA